MAAAQPVADDAGNGASPRVPLGNGLLVLGVGRSGTSIATRIAVQLGMRPPRAGDLMPADQANPDGYWESTQLALLNDRLLAHWGATWWTPPAAVTAQMITLLDVHRAAAEEAFRDVFGDGPGWVWKDPRLVMLIEFWSGVVGPTPVLVVTRDPHEVARSISRRDGLSVGQGLAIWERQTRLLLTHLAGNPVLLLDYAQLVAAPDAWQQQLTAFCQVQGLDVAVARESPARLVRARQPDRSRRDEGLSPEATELVRILGDLAGSHVHFPALELDPETAECAACIESVDADTVRERSAPRPRHLDATYGDGG